jgi:hypothetical protein
MVLALRIVSVGVGLLLHDKLTGQASWLGLQTGGPCNFRVDVEEPRGVSGNFSLMKFAVCPT